MRETPDAERCKAHVGVKNSRIARAVAEGWMTGCQRCDMSSEIGKQLQLVS